MHSGAHPKRLPAHIPSEYVQATQPQNAIFFPSDAKPVPERCTYTLLCTRQRPNQ